MITEFRATIVLAINVEHIGDVEIARAVAAKSVDEIRQNIPVCNWTESMPKTVEEVASAT